MQIKVTVNEKTSAATPLSQIPSNLRKIGSMKMAATSNTKVRKNEITAETIPLLSAVKKDEPIMLKPHRR